ncbi:hypothetical protein [Acetobacter malorum]|nr:hypothetical protein [Acetobacter malorum]
MTDLEIDNVSNAQEYLKSNDTYSDQKFSANVIIRGFGKCEDISNIRVKTNIYDTNLVFEFDIDDIGEEESGKCPSAFHTKSFHDNKSIWSFNEDTLTIKGKYFGKEYTAEFSPVE